MAVTSAQIVEFLLANPSMSDADIADAMATYGVSPADMAKATGLDEGVVAARVAATLPPNEAVLLGDTYVQAVNQVIGSGEDQQVGGLENVITYKESDNKVGGDVNYFSPTGEYQQTTKQQEVDAAKDFGKFLLAAGTMFGLPAGIGEAIGLGTGATANAVGTGLLSGTSTAIGGGNLEDIAKAALIGGGASLLGSTVSDLITPTVDASQLTAEQLNDIINEGFAADLKKAGVTNVSEFTTNVGGNAGTFYDAAGNPVVAPPTVAPPVTTPVAPTVSGDNVVITAPKAVAPPTVPSLSSVIGTIATPPIETVKVTDTKEKDKTATPTIPTTATDTVTVTAPRPVVPPTTTAPPFTPTVPLVPPVVVAPPTTPPKPPPEPPPKDKKEVTITDVIKTIAPIVIPALVAKAVTPTPPTTGFDIVPVPADWKTPPATGVAPFTPLPPIDFGTRNLLMGTQWEKFLDPNYGKVPEPIKYSQPSSLSYNDLMGILGSRQGMPPASSLSINDIISGIQNQYGQAPTRTMG